MLRLVTVTNTSLLPPPIVSVANRVPVLLYNAANIVVALLYRVQVILTLCDSTCQEFNPV